uniref:40S ribosomal protein S27 n=1 Tax=Poecilia mexicana TaxID=48701 RepID=A0A3B3XHK1_9TELE
MPLAKDLLYPSLADERRKHKKKRLVQNPNSYFMDVKCIGCYRISTIFSHAHTVVACPGCSVILCRPRGGKCRLTAGGIGSYQPASNISDMCTPIEALWCSIST